MKRKKKRRTPSSPKKHHQRSSKHRNNKKAIISLQICPVLFFSSIFKNETFDIVEAIKQIERPLLLKIVSYLTNKYDNCTVEDIKEGIISTNSIYYTPIFSAIESFRYNQLYGSKNIIFSTTKTLLELLKYVFSCKQESSMYELNNYEKELIIFKLILKINEQIYDTNLGDNNISEALYSELYTHNSINDHEKRFRNEVIEQCVYSTHFFKFISKNQGCNSIYTEFLNHFQIKNWESYSRSILALAMTPNINNNMSSGLIDIEKYDPEGIINRNMLNHISININEDIDINKNTDFVEFRSRPIIKESENEYRIFSKQFIIKRLYDSLFFDLKKIFPNKVPFHNQEIDTGLFFRKYFVEKYLFDRIVLDCVCNNPDITFPSENQILSELTSDDNEVDEQPDFYIRKGNNIFILECKAIKLNGQLKDSNDIGEISNNLKNKLVAKTTSNNKSIGKTKKEGVGQLVQHIHNMENGTFKMDDFNFNDNEVNYFPILVLENSEINQPPLTPILNKQYQELLNLDNTINKRKCHRLIVTNIISLFKCKNAIKREGLASIISEYEKEEISKLRNFDSVLLSKEDTDTCFKEIVKGILYKNPSTFPTLLKSHQTLIYEAVKAHGI